MSPRVIDERWVKHEQARWSGAERKPLRSDLAQFTLRGLLTFSTAITVCLSLGVTGVRMNAGAGELLVGAAGVLAWIVLFETYRRLRVRPALRLHWAGPVFIVGLWAMVCLTEGKLATLGPRASAFLSKGLVCTATVMLFYGCSLGLILSLPVFVVTMIGLLLKSALRRPR